jgi:hypothetical protein
VSATVSNDPASAGIDWIATCGAATNCGHFSPPHTDSGAATTFWAPPAVPAHKTIAVTALSTTDHSKAAAFSVTLVSTVTGITFTQLPPATAPAGSTITLSAAVTGDPANLGVDWKADCGGIDCTSAGFPMPRSLPGQNENFVIPDPSVFVFSNIVGSTVTITAFAAADHSFSAVTTFQVSAPIVVTITQKPPASMVTNATANVVAVVQNDPTNSGVQWHVSCASASCGTISPQQTASGVAAVYTAPADLPSATNPVVLISAQAAAAPSAASSNDKVAVTIVLPLSLKITQNVANGTIVQNHSAPLIAAVSNDTANAGVDWSVTCGSQGSCGTFSPAHTVSGAATSYTAPAAIPAGGTVTITAASTSDPTKTDTQTVTVTAGAPPDSLLSGTFVMLLSSNQSQSGAYMLGGLITGNGSGTITNANFDLADASGNTGNSIGLLPGSTYSIGPDGRGQLQLLINTGAVNAGSHSFGVGCGSTPNCGSLTLSVAFATPQHAILNESDSFGTATGTLDLQDPQAPSGISPGVYSLTLSGSENAQPTAAFLLASALTIPSLSCPSFTNCYSYITDQSDGGAITSVPFTTASQPFPINGLRVSSLNLGLPSQPLQFNLDLWPIDATHFVVTDVLDTFSAFRAPAPTVIVSGHLTAQPAAPALSGTYVFTEKGATTAAQPMAAGGIFTCGSPGTPGPAGTLDVVPLVGSGTPPSSNQINATCGALANGRSVITMTSAGSTGISKFGAYPTVDQGLYLIELDGGAAGPSGAGVALQQTTAPISAATFSGKYASNFSASTALGSQNFAGQVISDGVSALSGTGDVNSFDGTAATPIGTPSLGATFSGTYSSANNGRFPIILTITPASGQPSPQITNLNLACYLVDANTCMLLGLDAAAPGTGLLLLQNTGL